MASMQAIAVCSTTGTPITTGGRTLPCTTVDGSAGNLVTMHAYVMESASDSALGPLLDMTPNDALVISAAVAGLFAIAWVFKQVARTFEGNVNADES